MKELLKQFLVYGLGTSIGKFISLLLLPIYARAFDVSDYGVLDFIITVTVILSVFGMFQIETGLQRYYYEKDNEEEKKKIATTAFFFTLICSIIILFLSFFFVEFISVKYFGDKYQKELVVSLLSIPFSNILIILFVLMRFKKQTKLYLYLSISQVILTAAITVIMVLWAGYGIMGVLFSSTIIAIFICLFAFVLMKNDINYKYIDKECLSEMLMFGLPQFPARLGSLSNTYINRFFMISYLSTYALGIYSVSLKIASGMQLITSAFQLAWPPFLYESLKKDSTKSVLIDVYKHTILIICFLIICVSLVSKEIVLLLTTKEYLEAYKFVAPLTLYFGFFLLKEIIDIGVKVVKKTKYTSYIYFLSAGLNIFLLFILIPSLGIQGVIYALLISNLFLYFSTYFISNRLYPISYPKKYILILCFTCFFSILSMSYELPATIRYLMLLFVSFLFFFYVRFHLIKRKII